MGSGYLLDPNRPGVSQRSKPNASEIMNLELADFDE
jgi:hypothetical protein